MRLLDPKLGTLATALSIGKHIRNRCTTIITIFVQPLKYPPRSYPQRLSWQYLLVLFPYEGQPAE